MTPMNIAANISILYQTARASQRQVKLIDRRHAGRAQGSFRGQRRYQNVGPLLRVRAAVQRQGACPQPEPALHVRFHQSMFIE